MSSMNVKLLVGLVVIGFVLASGAWLFLANSGKASSVTKCPTLMVAGGETQTGDIVVGESETRTIENESFILEGNIIINSGGTLTIRNSDITVNSHYKNQYWVYVYSNATLLVENSILREGPVSGLAHMGSFGGISDFRQGETLISPEGQAAQVILRNTTSELRIGPGPDSTVTLDSSYLSILAWRSFPSVRTTVMSSNINVVHMWLYGETEENVELSGISGGENQSTHLSVEGAVLDIENTSVGSYSVALWVAYGDTKCKKNLTVKNSALYEIFAVFPIGSYVRLWNMAPGSFENWNIYDSMEGNGVPWNLNLINTTITKWKLDFHGVTEIENSNFHLDTWGNASVTVRNSTVILHHTRGGRVKFVNTLISCRPDLPASMRFLYQPDTTGPNPSYVYEFENSTLGPYAELDLTDDNIHCTFKGELSVQISSDQVHWFGGTVKREFPAVVWKENNGPLANIQLTLLGPDNVQVWSGQTNENGRTTFELTFSKDNYMEEFTLNAAVENENLTTRVKFLTSTPILLSATAPTPPQTPTSTPTLSPTTTTTSPTTTTPTTPPPAETTWIWVGVGIAIVVIIAVVALVLTRKGK